MSHHDDRTYEERLMDYVCNHAASAELNKDRALVSGSADDLAWAYFLRDVTAFAAERLTKVKRKVKD